MLTMAPGAYLLIGLVCFWPTEREMTVRACYSSLRRMDRALRIMVPLAGICLAGCIVHAVLTPASLTSSAELRYYICAVLSCAAVIFEFVYLRKKPVIIVRDPEPESARIEELAEKSRRKAERKQRIRR